MLSTAAVSLKKSKFRGRDVPMVDDVQDDAAPFDHEEEHPEPMEMDILEQDEWNEEHCAFTDDDEPNYDASSITSEPEERLPTSVQGSPVFSRWGSSVVVEPQSPPGVPITFDDESFIV